jgi:hypothetical protein
MLGKAQILAAPNSDGPSTRSTRVRRIEHSFHSFALSLTDHRPEKVLRTLADLSTSHACGPHAGLHRAQGCKYRASQYGACIAR